MIRPVSSQDPVSYTLSLRIAQGIEQPQSNKDTLDKSEPKTGCLNAILAFIKKWIFCGFCSSKTSSKDKTFLPQTEAEKKAHTKILLDQIRKTPGYALELLETQPNNFYAAIKEDSKLVIEDLAPKWLEKILSGTKGENLDEAFDRAVLTDKTTGERLGVHNQTHTPFEQKLIALLLAERKNHKEKSPELERLNKEIERIRKTQGNYFGEENNVK